MLKVGRGVLAAVVIVFALASPAPADEPLNQYVVEGAAGELGYDVTEGAIAATPSQARALRAQGLSVTPVGAESTAPAPSVTLPLADPTWGYDVFRPYALNPAPCQTTCSGATDGAGQPVNLRTYYETLAAAHPTLVERVTYGTSLNGTELVAYRVTAGADTSEQGTKPGVMYAGAQHAREWISPEVVRRGFSYVLAHAADGPSGIPAVLASTELWFVPVQNPDGYDYTFQARATRLWRKNLRDVDGDGTIASGDGVDTNRNFPEKWNYDDEGSSGTPSNETYRGAAPQSEPEVASFHALMERIKPEFFIDFHSYAKLVLYPVGWQVETYGGDNPLMAALAGTDQHPAVAGYDPDVGGELYTTNGEVTDTMYTRHAILSYTVELDGGSGAAVGGTTTAGNAFGSNPGGFVFQDRESDVEAVFAKNLPFMLDLARSAPAPDQPVSHIGAQIPDFVPTAFGISYGSPQTVEVNVRRALGPVLVKWTVAGSPTVHQAATNEFGGGERYGKPGVYFHRMRGSVTGFAAGEEVTVWFDAGGKSSAPFTFTASPAAHGRRVLVLSAEDYTGLSPNTTPTAGPAHLATYLEALADAGQDADVYDIDATGRGHADLLGVLGHYQAVVWYTGQDDFVRDPGQTSGVSKLFDDQLLAIRDYLNEGGKVLVTGQRALQGAWSEELYNPLGRFPAFPQCPRSSLGSPNPAGQLENCVNVSNDFLQYWMGAGARSNQATSAAAVSALTLVGQSPFSGSFSLTGQAYLPRFTPASSGTVTHVVSGGENAVGVATPDTLLWGFGLENVADRTTRAGLIEQGLAQLGVHRPMYTCTCDGPTTSLLSLSTGSPMAFGTFTAGTARSHLVTGSASVLSTFADTTLTVADTSATSPGHLVNGAYALPQAVEARANGGPFEAVTGTPRNLVRYDGPVSNAAVAIEFRQSIGATDVLHSGLYSKTLTFTLSTTTP